MPGNSHLECGEKAPSLWRKFHPFEKIPIWIAGNFFSLEGILIRKCQEIPLSWPRKLPLNTRKIHLLLKEISLGIISYFSLAVEPIPPWDTREVPPPSFGRHSHAEGPDIPPHTVDKVPTPGNSCFPQTWRTFPLQNTKNHLWFWKKLPSQM